VGDVTLDAAVAAFAPIETLGASGLNPVMIGTQCWELMHAATGLPWWASIPLTTLALRTALLPLTVKARAATVNFALIPKASAASRVLWQRMQQEQQQAAAAAGSAPSSGGGGGGAGARGGKAVTRNQLTKQYLMYMRKQHGTPTTWWYSVNALVQVWRPVAAVSRERAPRQLLCCVIARLTASAGGRGCPAPSPHLPSRPFRLGHSPLVTGESVPGHVCGPAPNELGDVARP
jgi:hypothetical protein